MFKRSRRQQILVVVEDILKIVMYDKGKKTCIIIKQNYFKRDCVQHLSCTRKQPRY